MFHHKAVIERAQQLRLPVQISRMQDRDLAELETLGTDLLVVGSYQWRIGGWSRHLPHAVNFHPSPLPHGRGPYPL